MHKLMVEENVGVNLVAEDESEADEDEDEDEDEGWWVGTVGVTERRCQTKRRKSWVRWSSRSQGRKFAAPA